MCHMQHAFSKGTTFHMCIVHHACNGFEGLNIYTICIFDLCSMHLYTRASCIFDLCSILQVQHLTCATCYMCNTLYVQHSCIYVQLAFHMNNIVCVQHTLVINDSVMRVASDTWMTHVTHLKRDVSCANLMALLRKETWNIRYPVHFRHPVAPWDKQFFLVIWFPHLKETYPSYKFWPVRE